MTARQTLPAAGPFRDLSEFLTDAEPIRLPIRGKVYEFPGSVSGRTGLLLSTALDAGLAASSGTATAEAAAADPELVELLGDEQEESIRAELFGGTDREMVRDGLDSHVIRHVFLTLIMWHVAGPEAAVTAWESAGNGQAPTPNRAARRSRTASAVAAPKTPRRASTSGTRAAPAARAASSRSRTSSSAGR